MAVLWVALGLLAVPGGRFDLAGALLLPLFAACVLSSGGGLYAAAFLMASLLELEGTAFGAWVWSPVTPFFHLPSGNPPSAIAAVYCLLDCAALATTQVLVRGLARRSPDPMATSAAASTTGPYSGVRITVAE
jgi:hypothetical protein